MSFGLSNAAPNPQMFVDEVTRGLENVCLYPCGILVASPSAKQYSAHLPAPFDHPSKHSVRSKAMTLPCPTPEEAAKAFLSG